MREETDQEFLGRLVNDLRTNITSQDRERLRRIMLHLPVRKQTMPRCVNCNTPVPDKVCWYCGYYRSTP